MRGWLLALAVVLLRSWTRAYTRGTHAEVRRRRCAEIESDLWEALHDPENADATGVHILIRLARGMPADLSWRLEHAFGGQQFMWRKLALLCIAAATVVAIFSLSRLSEPLSLPNLPAEPVPNYVEKRRGPPPPPPPPPSWEEFVAKVNGRQQR
jgi:hypothetical protein